MITKTKNFRIGKAEYFIGGEDSSAKLFLNYADDSFDIEIILQGKDLDDILVEGKIIAKHLLNDKAKLNLIERIKGKINK